MPKEVRTVPDTTCNTDLPEDFDIIVKAHLDKINATEGEQKDQAIADLTAYVDSCQ